MASRKERGKRGAAAAKLDSAAPQFYKLRLELFQTRPLKAAPEQLGILGRRGPRFIARATGARASVNPRGLAPRASAEHEPAFLSRLYRHGSASRGSPRGRDRGAVAKRQSVFGACRGQGVA